jgi:hypothetical protein
MAYLAPAPAQLMDYENAERGRHPAIFREAPSSAQLGPHRSDEPFSWYLELEQAFTSLRDQLSTLRALGVGWDGYRAPAPAATALEAAQRALAVLRLVNAKPSAVVPAVDGGVGICFVKENRYAHLEFANDGDVWVLMYGPTGSPESWQLASGDTGSIREGWTRISAHLQF